MNLPHTELVKREIAQLDADTYTVFELGEGIASAHVKQSEIDSDTLEIAHIQVAEEYRGHGYGSHMFEHVLKHARELGHKALQLNCANERTAHPFRRFAKDKLSFFKYENRLDLYLELDTSLQGVVQYLEEGRKRMPKNTRPDEQLKRSILIVADLT
jgi:GNAT superfamily N-acetyltransferase